MKLNIAHPRNGTCQQFEIIDDVLRRIHMTDYRLGNEVDGAIFGDEFKGYVFRIHGGSDREGFPMVHGVMAPSRVSLLVHRGAVGFQRFRGSQGERRRKALRGCILNHDIAVLNVVVMKDGEQPIKGVTDTSAPRRLGPKRASAIRKVFGLNRDEDVRQIVIRRKVSKAGKKDRYKAAKIQRLVTPAIRARRALKVKHAKEALAKNADVRRAFLTSVSRARMARRQQKNAALHRKKVVIEKVDVPQWKAAGSPKH
eukprot:TRINITY_DN3568_c0_g1_i2.p1 TRINITY_DN3568_c0_g1~~TRINITY_DN3568_c0_g1_i2.p1  ORF type:complete len:255 (-),score=107.89 TRINITY_DN3568_c0_g1_i2:194-958(-)